MPARRSSSGGKTITKPGHSSLQYRTPMEFARQSPIFDMDEVGERASNAGPFPHTSIPAINSVAGGEQKPEKVSLSLD